tara:strand:- start:1915 stop:2601 length:687 start_codon:yes stop_codon:yes gene_type:complete
MDKNKMPNKENLRFGTDRNASGLGDTLLLTAVCKNLQTKPTILLHPNKERFSILFDKIANVEVTTESLPLSNIGGGHYTTQKLKNFYSNAQALDIRPMVLHTCIESEIWADNIIRSLDKPPLIWQPHCCPSWHKTRSIPNYKHQDIIGEYQDRHSILDLSNEPYKNIPLSKYICLLRKCGMYVGCNTGDMHLAIAVGCSCEIHEPPSCRFFQSEKWKYNHPSITYKKF